MEASQRKRLADLLSPKMCSVIFLPLKQTANDLKLSDCISIIEGLTFSAIFLQRMTWIERHLRLYVYWSQTNPRALKELFNQSPSHGASASGALNGITITPQEIRCLRHNRASADPILLSYYGEMQARHWLQTIMKRRRFGLPVLRHLHNLIDHRNISFPKKKFSILENRENPVGSLTVRWAWRRSMEGKLSPIIAASIAHQVLLMHPVSTKNSTIVARLVAEAILFRGGYEFLAATPLTVALLRRKEQYAHILSLIDNEDPFSLPQGIALCIEEFSIALLDACIRVSRRLKLRWGVRRSAPVLGQRLLALLANLGTIDLATATQLLDAKRSSISSALKKLTDKGIVLRMGKGKKARFELSPFNVENPEKRVY